ncbi:hypothetical protein EP7_003795 [Isosphaeraceae bacterium EP7]
MVRRRVFRWCLAVAALSGVRAASADAINFTGNVANDMVISKTSNTVQINRGAGHVAQAKWMTDRGWTSGWSINDMRLSYDQKTDTMFVGVNFFGIAGDSDGNGDPGSADAKTLASGGIDLAHLGGRKSISVAFAPDSASGLSKAGAPVLIAGVPADKSQAGTGINGFNVAAYKPSNMGIAYNYGKTLTDHMGALAFDPSAEHPGFEFTITNFSKIVGLDPSKGFWVQAFAGSPDDIVAGEDSVPLTRIGPLSPQVPEPTTVVAWGSVLLGGALWRSRRRRASA